MVLIDDPGRTVIEPLFAEPLETLYDFPLMMNGGRVRGGRIEHPMLIQWVIEQLARLADPVAFNVRYGVSDEPVLLYAMGDGNHSFATAKIIWENLKRAAPDPAAIMNHPARHRWWNWSICTMKVWNSRRSTGSRSTLIPPGCWRR